MLQFAVTAYDYAGALERRLATRPLHAQGLVKLIDSGNLLSAGAILDAQNNMIGSSVHIQFESQDEFDLWLAKEPYNTETVWETIDVKQVKFFSS